MIRRRLSLSPHSRTLAARLCATVLASIPLVAQDAGAVGPDLEAAPSRSGIYPHLSVWNEENECGIGAVVPWAGSLWLVTYAPHKPNGSTDRLYAVGPELTQRSAPESIGGTPAGRMVHRETGQLVIGPHVIDAEGGVRTVPYARMPGRHTAVARHLTEPERKVYVATMEEGLYELDLVDLAVREIFADGNGAGRESERYVGGLLPGYHGKGLYAAADRLVYANNGDRDPRVTTDPTTPSGALATWRPGEAAWSLVQREQYTEVTGPGGIAGNADPSDPLWTLGWDHRSVLLSLFEDGTWSTFRLPKASHSYDGAHGWNTEWPRIRSIRPAGAPAGDPDEELLATMHGTFWAFPAGFARGRTAGIRPRSSYLKVIGDFARWGDRVVLGCDDVAASEFLNGRPQKSPGSRAGQAHSNLWFVAPEALEGLGPALGRGCVWMDEDVAADSASLPFLFAGYDRRVLHLRHATDRVVQVGIELDRSGDGTFEAWETLTLEAGGSRAFLFPEGLEAAWLRLRVDEDASGLTAALLYAEEDPRRTADELAPGPFEGLALRGAEEPRLDAVLWSTGGGRHTLAAAPVGASADPDTLFELGLDLGLAAGDASLRSRTLEAAQSPGALVRLESAWAWEEGGTRWLFPRAPASFGPSGAPEEARVVREVVTERDLLLVDGSFYELPARNAGGVAFVRPIATTRFAPSDFAGFAGLLAFAGVRASALDPQDPAANNPHLVRSPDGSAALWVGALDDLWRLGKPVGVGGPWSEAAVRAGEPSDPFLFTGYDRKRARLQNHGPEPVTLLLEVDVTGTGTWIPAARVSLAAGETAEHVFPTAFLAYWIRAVSDRDGKVSVELTYS